MERNSLFGEKITYSREKLGFNKKDFADMISVSPSALSRYEKGISMPSVMTLYMISLLADMPMDSFVDENFSLEEFKELNAKTLNEMIIECYNDIVKEFSL